MSNKAYISSQSSHGSPAEGGGRGRGRGRGTRRPFFRARGSSRGMLGSSSVAVLADVILPTPEKPVPEPLDDPGPPKGCPFVGWTMYFLHGSFDGGIKPPASCVPVFVKYFKKRLEKYNVATIVAKQVFDVDLIDLCEDADVKKGLSYALYKSESFGDVVVRNWLLDGGERGVGEALSVLGIAMHHVVDHALRGGDDSLAVVPFLQPRIREHGPISPMRDLRTESYGKVVSVRGTIVRVGPTKLVCKRMVYKCDVCGKLFAYRGVLERVVGGSIKVVQPEKCPKFNSKSNNKNAVPAEEPCRSKQFSLCFESRGMLVVDGRTIQIQELMTDGEQRQSGRMPRIISVELERDLISECPAGDVVTVTGLVQVGEPDGTSGSEGGRTKHSLIINALYLGNDKEISMQRTNGCGVYFSDLDHMAFEELKREKNIFRLLVQSVCPAIFGHDIVKAALILALFGGCRKGGEFRDASGSAQESNSVPIRGDVHVLVVGDPGLGKSQLLKAAVDVAPRGVYICGNLSTSAGLTVSMSNGALEAGAVVLSDRGVCCIDEFDKMSKQHEALLEVMEQQTVSIAKAGVVCCVPARATILAAANPRGGHYNAAKTVAENLRLIMPARLRPDPGENLDPVPHQILRKYVAFARANVRPTLTQEARDVLQTFYLELRKNQSSSSDSVPITTRQLESLIRLTEARAKLELREEATVEDALEVVELMKFSIVQTRSVHGSGMSKSTKLKRLLSILESEAESNGSNLFSEKLLHQLIKRSSDVNPSAAIESLNTQGFLLMMGNRMYKLLSSSF
ncbi:unnamed protein product [Notodromas monacha]|uniref:DNA helicase n=1 Tax=Notodromas monacha TaxID=399045 RepID=A0A7R9BTK3_9CRUS|nr:unnamed protein product [Notodromas monacha]CAG0920450.1 unnamed protein product [Notodromas monacha]